MICSNWFCILLHHNGQRRGKEKEKVGRRLEENGGEGEVNIDCGCLLGGEEYWKSLWCSEKDLLEEKRAQWRDDLAGVQEV